MNEQKTAILLLSFYLKINYNFVYIAQLELHLCFNQIEITLFPEAHCYPAPSCLAAGRSLGVWSAARQVTGRPQGPGFQWEELVGV